MELPRLTTHSIILSSKIQIPEKTIVISNLFLLNHNETTFEDALNFNPFRFEKGCFSNYSNFLKLREGYKSQMLKAKTFDHNLLKCNFIQETVNAETDISCMNYLKPIIYDKLMETDNKKNIFLKKKWHPLSINHRL